MTQAPPVLNVLFVCMGNICRSPAAECLFRDYVQKQGWTDRIYCESAGTIGFHEGNPPDARIRDAGRSRGYRIEGSARQIRPEDFQRFDLIVTMDEENFRNVRHLASSRTGEEKVRPLCGFCREFSDQAVPDPYYGGGRGFEHVLDLLEDAVAGLFSECRRKWEEKKA